jgi:hypothetical protein
LINNKSPIITTVVLQNNHPIGLQSTKTIFKKVNKIFVMKMTDDPLDPDDIIGVGGRIEILRNKREEIDVNPKKGIAVQIALPVD